MNEAMNTDNIAQFVQQQGFDPDEQRYYLYGQIDSKFSTYPLFTVDEKEDLEIKHLLLFFSPSQLIIACLDLSGNFTDKVIRKTADEMQAVTFKKSFMLNTLTLTVDGKTYDISIPNRVVAAKWQKKNLSELIKNNFFDVINN